MMKKTLIRPEMLTWHKNYKTNNRLEQRCQEGRASLQRLWTLATEKLEWNLIHVSLCNIWKGYLVKKCKHFLLVLPKLPTKILHQFISFILSWKRSRFYHLKNFSLFYKENKNLFLIVLVTIYIYSPFFLLCHCSYIRLFRKVADSGLYSQMISLCSKLLYVIFRANIFYPLFFLFCLVFIEKMLYY